MKIRSFTIVTLILTFFLLVKHVRVLVSVVTGSDIAGAAVDDIVILALVLGYITYSLGVRGGATLRSDRVRVFLLATLAAALLQVVYFGSTFGGDAATVLFRAFSSFRKVFMPLMLLFVFSFMIKQEMVKRGDVVITRYVRLFTIFLWIAMIYSFLEGALRTFSPAFNAAYLDYFYSSLLRSANPGSRLKDVPIAVLVYIGGPLVKRVYGIGLQMFATGGIIFACYLVHVFMSGRFKVLSSLNALVFAALLLSGSRQYFVPFLVLNMVFFVRQYGRRIHLAPLIPLIVTGGAAFVIWFMIPTFDKEVGYSTYIARSLDPMRQNLGLFLWGIGPVGFTPTGQEIAWKGDLRYELYHTVEGTGYMAVGLEIGIFMSALLFLLHVVVFRTKGALYGRRRPPDRVVKGLKWVIALNAIVTLAHWSMMFDRTIIAFHVFFLSLLYSWSTVRYSVGSTRMAVGASDGAERGQPPHPAGRAVPA